MAAQTNIDYAIDRANWSDGELVDPDLLNDMQKLARRQLGESLYRPVYLDPGNIWGSGNLRPLRDALQTVANGVDMIVTVQANYSGSFWLDQVDPGTPTPQAFLHKMAADWAFPVDAADPANPRNDIITAKIEFPGTTGNSATRVFKDNATGVISAQSTDTRSRTKMTLTYTPGVADASPVDPAVPSGEVLIARIIVGAGVTTLSIANIQDERRPASLCTHDIPLTHALLGGTWVQSATLGSISGGAANDIVMLPLVVPRRQEVNRRLKSIIFDGRINSGGTVKLVQRDPTGAPGPTFSDLDDLTSLITLNSYDRDTILFYGSASLPGPRWANGSKNPRDTAFNADSQLWLEIMSGGGTERIIDVQVTYWGD